MECKTEYKKIRVEYYVLIQEEHTIQVHVHMKQTHKDELYLFLIVLRPLRVVVLNKLSKKRHEEHQLLSARV